MRTAKLTLSLFVLAFMGASLQGAVPINITSATADGFYKAGDVIAIQVTFDEIIFVTGTPQIKLETGTPNAVVDYASGSGTTTLLFFYTVAAGHTASDLDYVSTDPLQLKGGTIKNGAGEDATLSLPIPGTAGSLGANKQIVIDTAAPAPPQAPDLQASSDSGSSSADNVTGITMPAFDIIGVESDATVTIFSSVEGALGSTLVAEGSESCSLSLAMPLSEGGDHRSSAGQGRERQRCFGGHGA
ncbi:MAG: hypothetical protein C3F08_07655 [Candidatus Methylomirabilota bacterium]|nr:MAG: hypothetical protein C3F08_07655 [candidate division NC10 bacterium]